MPIRTAAAIHGALGWILAAQVDNDLPRSPVSETILTGGRYVAALNRVDCEGCAAAVESAVQRVRGIGMAGVTPQSSTLVFEIADGARVHLSDIQETLAAVSEGLNTVIALAGLRGPLPPLFSAA